MFSNPGDKMKDIATLNFVIGLIVSVLLAIFLIFKGNDLNRSYVTKGSGDILIWSGIIAGVLGIVVSLTVSFTLATLGSISKSIDSMVYFARKREYEGNYLKDTWVCKNCGENNTLKSVFCASCGEHK